jgi:hypothetical protein
MESIQDWLVAKGFVIDQAKEVFLKQVNYYQTVTIPFAELSGQTLATFKQKAVDKGWLEAREVR